jgi:hypothetical protein
LRLVDPDGSSHAVTVSPETELRALLKREARLQAELLRLRAELVRARKRYCEKHRILIAPHMDRLRAEYGGGQ